MKIDLKANLGKRSSELELLLHNARLMNYTKNRRWIAKLIDTGKIMSCDGTNIIGGRKTTFQRSLFTMMDILDRKRGDDWDLDVSYQSDYDAITLKFLLKYDDFTISNSNGESHNIKGLIVVMPVNYRASVGACPGSLSGTRIALDINEISCNYQHSHLSTTESKKYEQILKERAFCMGHGDLGFLRADVANGERFNADQFEAMLYTLDTYVAWESIEGGPHIRIGNIVSTKSKSLANLSVATYSYSLSEEIRRQNSIPVDFYIHEGRYRIKDNKRWDEYLKQLSIEHLPHAYTKFFCKQHPVNKQYYSIESANITPPNYNMKHPQTGEQAYIIYGGQKVYFKVYGYSQEIMSRQIDLREFFIYPNLSQDVRNKIEQYLYTAAVRNSTIKKYNSSRNVGRNSEQSEVSM